MFNRYAKYYDIFNSKKPYEEEVKFVYEWAEKPKSIFDIGCGTGNYWKFFPKETQIVGVERSKEMSKQENQTTRNVINTDIRTYKHPELLDCATALFDVINYIPKHGWWRNIPVRQGGYFIFDIWDKEKATKEGFSIRETSLDGYVRVIEPISIYDNRVVLKIQYRGPLEKRHNIEIHRMYLHSEDDIKRFCGKWFEIVDKKETSTWQTWYKCKRL